MSGLVLTRLLALDCWMHKLHQGAIRSTREHSSGIQHGECTRAVNCAHRRVDVRVYGLECTACNVQVWYALTVVLLG